MYPSHRPIDSLAIPTTATGPRSAAAVRLYFFDHLRAVVILLVILLHAAMTYMAYPPPWWYVIEPENSLWR